MSGKGAVPGVFWVVLIVILVPALTPVLEQVFPSASYQWSAVLVVVLASVAKTAEIVYRKQIDAAMSGDAAASSSPRPAALEAGPGGPMDGDDYTYDRPQAEADGPLAAWLFG